MTGSHLKGFARGPKQLPRGHLASKRLRVAADRVAMQNAKENVVGDLKPTREFPRDIHHQERKQMDILSLQLDERMPRKHDQLRVFHCESRGRVPVHGHQGRLSKTLPDSELLLFENDFAVGNRQVNASRLHNIDMGRLIAFAEDIRALLYNSAL